LTNEKSLTKLAYEEGVKPIALEEGGKKGRSLRMSAQALERRRYVFVRILCSGDIRNEQ